MRKWNQVWTTGLMVSVPIAALLATGHALAGSDDFGLMQEQQLQSMSLELFGIEAPLSASASPTEVPYRRPDQPATDQIALAQGLEAEYLTREVGDWSDMMAFWPPADPTHLIACIEKDVEVISTNADGSDKLNPSVQRIDLATGAVETILRGMSDCDGVRATAWGTVVATEEENDGGAYEILDPLAVTEVTVTDRASGTVTDPTSVVKRVALPTMSWEGLVVLPSGVVIAGDELRPGTDVADTDGGSIYKFVPAERRTGEGAITSLDQSPLAAGTAYALQISCYGEKQQFGQGCEVGNGIWIEVTAPAARRDAFVKGATGYYRPEDMHVDPMFGDPDNPNAVRFCWTNTGREAAGHFGEVMCAVDADPMVIVDDAGEPVRSTLVNRFLEGDLDFNSVDNLEFQPKTGNLYVIEDHENGDIFACLPDGADRDLKTDGCIKILSVKDSSAEPTGFMFDASGEVAYFTVQHSDDEQMPKVDDYGTDDLIKITGFKVE